MKKYFYYTLLSALCTGCIVAHTNNNIIEFDKSLLGNKTQIVTKSFIGSPLILSLLPVGEAPDTKASLLELMNENKCNSLKNIEIEFYQWSFILIGFPKIKIIAQCIK